MQLMKVIYFRVAKQKLYRVNEGSCVFYFVRLFLFIMTFHAQKKSLCLTLTHTRQCHSNGKVYASEMTDVNWSNSFHYLDIGWDISRRWETSAVQQLSKQLVSTKQTDLDRDKPWNEAVEVDFRILHSNEVFGEFFSIFLHFKMKISEFHGFYVIFHFFTLKSSKNRFISNLCTENRMKPSSAT